ncbi:endonuclease MutS2 (plasmid) [Cytobacillus spongiae]|uniref:endonuclease MutS2 n=1 Tax=Cytobacillus spongiae TaxID=2901381 RepID=UPI001F411355|nr:endonuclease MutS2 [Cytobacillus spongiae]UII58507.1 endonuclease MutS2 [Cytobacillus spongiae]
MNEKTYLTLEFNKVKEDISQFALTVEGKKELMNLLPSTNKRQIEMRLDEVTEAVRILEKSASIPIHALEGVENIVANLNNGVPLRPDQLTSLYYFLDACKKLKRFMEDKEWVAPRVSSYVYSIENIPEVGEEINRCIRNGRVDDYATKELVRIRKQMGIQEERLKDKIQSIVKSSKYKSYLQESIVSQRNGRYVLPVKKEYKGKVKGAELDASASGSTFYIEPEELSIQQDQLLYYKLDEEREVENILWTLTGLVQQYEPQLKLAIETMIHYDVLFAKAKYSRSMDAVGAIVNEDHKIYLKEAVHPLLGNQAVPLSIRMGEDFHALVITGPNTGGKTVTIKTVGLLTLMTQCGLHIPASAGSEISIYEKILLDIGDGQSLQQNLSTFSSHIKNIIDLLKETNDRTLVLLDELGSGTDPLEGMGLATAILYQLYEKGATILATTHYSELKHFAEEHEGFLNGSMEFNIDTLQPTYRLLVGEGGESQAFAIALKLGMHPQIIESAHEITYREKKNYDLGELDYHEKKEMDMQVIVNKYKNRVRSKTPQRENASPLFNKGDNVKVSSSGEFGIVYEGPNERGDYMVQIKGEKKTINHKRLTLYVSAQDLYPEGYDFDIIFNSKENRKKDKLMGKRFVEGLTIDHED